MTSRTTLFLSGGLLKVIIAAGMYGLVRSYVGGQHDMPISLLRALQYVTTAWGAAVEAPKSRLVPALSSGG